MKRKTNLFYTTGQDSNFLTFSNFTEALTGNFLSTDWKVYPSRFLCLYIPSLMDENGNLIEDSTDENNNVTKSPKTRFIEENLVSYYENKLAFLRDYYTEEFNSNGITNYSLEGDVNALAWLLQTIYDFDPETEFTFIGEVTEFDYKGTYTDSICIIDSSEGYGENNMLKKYSFDISRGEPKVYDKETDRLYGWEKEETNELAGSPYASSVPIFDITNGSGDDATNEYYIYSDYNLNTVLVDEDHLKFNVIIPLFDITNMYATTNFTTVEEPFSREENLEMKIYTYDEGSLVKHDIDYDDKAIRSINNPMGIWFSDELISLKRDPNSKYAPSWSLTISSQFKPFPYSSNYNNNDITSEDNQQAFATYAQILGMQTDLSDEIFNLSTRVTKLEQIVSRLNNLTNNETLQKILSLNSLVDEIRTTLSGLDVKIDDKVASAIESYKSRWK